MAIPTDDTADATATVLARLVVDLDGGFVDLVRAHEGAVYSVARSLSGRRDQADDLAAEAFLRAYRALRRYDRERILALRPRPWLLTILLNTWRNERRNAGRRPQEVPLADASGMSPQSSTEPVADMAEADAGLKHLLRLVAGLPSNQRAAVVLRHVVGLSTAEVATVLGCPEGTAKSHLSRGLRRLRAMLDRPPSPPPLRVPTGEAW